MSYLDICAPLFREWPVTVQWSEPGVGGTNMYQDGGGNITSLLMGDSSDQRHLFTNVRYQATQRTVRLSSEAELCLAVDEARVQSGLILGGINQSSAFQRPMLSRRGPALRNVLGHLI